jgi:ABC-type Mn2+/Zn2+ transport system permease subunit
MLHAIWSALADPWQEPIDRRAFLEVCLLGLSAGALGCWIIFYNLSYSAESLAHGMLPGLVAASLAGIPLVLGGAAGLVVAGLAVAAAGRTPAIGRDTAVAVVVTTLFGLGALLALAPDTPAALGELLFGDVLAVTDGDLALAAALALVVLGALRVLHGRMLVVGFDRLNAGALGAGPLLVDAALLVLVAVTILVAVQGLGNLLVVGLLVGPAACARLLARRMPAMMALATVIAISAGAGGIYLSYYASTAAGASIVAVIAACYLVALAVSRDSPRTPRGARPRAPRR